MSDRTNGQRKMNGDGDPTLRGSLDGVHATDEQLNAILDGALVASERAEVERHIDECATCQTQLTELRGMTAMLRALPEPRLRRSFQLGPEHQRRNDSIWAKLSSWLLPTLPALRATTVAVALLLAAVSIRNIVDDPVDRSVVSDIPQTTQASIPTEQPTEASSRNSAELQTNQAAAPTSESAPASQPEAAMADGEEQETSATEPTEQGYAAVAPPPDEGTLAESSEAPMADQSTDSALAQGGAAQPSAKSATGGDTGSFAAEETGDGDVDQEASLAPAGGNDESASVVTSADDNVAMVAEAPASPSPAPSPSATPLPPTATPTPTATATPSPSATPVPQPTATQGPVVITASTQGGSLDGWEAIQLILAVALVVLIALLVVLHRFSLRRRTIAR